MVVSAISQTREARQQYGVQAHSHHRTCMGTCWKPRCLCRCDCLIGYLHSNEFIGFFMYPGVLKTGQLVTPHPPGNTPHQPTHTCIIVRDWFHTSFQPRLHIKNIRHVLQELRLCYH